MQPMMTSLVKICGLRTTEAADKAIETGADLLGVIMVPNRKRTVSFPVSSEISKAAQLKREKMGRKFQTATEIFHALNQRKFTSHNQYFEVCARLIRENGPFLVGVFCDQDINDVFQLARDCSLDFIQLHGSEDVSEYLKYNENLEFGILKRFVIPDHIGLMKVVFPEITDPQFPGFFLPLLDSEAGGEGKTIDWTLIDDLDGRFLLAGGLNPDNLHETKPFLKNVIGFDVSGGVENEGGEKNLDKIEQFVVNSRHI